MFFCLLFFCLQFLFVLLKVCVVALPLNLFIVSKIQTKTIKGFQKKDTLKSVSFQKWKQ
jgi:hypothetical protein